MEWLTMIKSAIDYMEQNLDTVTGIEEIADSVHISAMYLQRGFQIITGYGIGEYLRNRRLYQAALKIAHSDCKVIDAAFDSGYETPESFSKAFARFHGFPPSEAKKRKQDIRTFLPLKINISISGGNQMNYKITPMFPIKVIGFQKIFDLETAYAEIPKYWDEICEKYAANVYAGNAPANPYEKAIVDNCIGEYGVCIDDIGGGKFRYLIAGKYAGGDVPEGMVIYEFPRNDWAVFDCVGPIPETLQSANTQIFKEWLPGNKEYELCGNANIEWYDCINGEKTDTNYHSAIWIPVKKKSQ